MKRRAARWAAAALLRAAGGVATWWALNEGVLPYPWVMAGFVGAATWVSLRLRPPARSVRVLPLVKVFGFLLRHMASAAWDVAQRALRPSLPVSPGFRHFRMALPPGGARRFFLGVVNLLPGTASVREEGDTLVVHQLVVDAAVEVELRRLEALLSDVVR